MNSTALGLVAGALTTGAWLPQIARIMRLRRAEELSWGYIGAFGAGIVGWLAYGLLRSDIAIVVANAVTLALLMAVAGLKFSTRQSESQLADHSEAAPG